MSFQYSLRPSQATNTAKDGLPFEFDYNKYNTKYITRFKVQTKPCHVASYGLLTFLRNTLPKELAVKMLRHVDPSKAVNISENFVCSSLYQYRLRLTIYVLFLNA